MFIQCSTVKRNGKVSRNRKLAESYRDPKTKQPRVRTVKKIEGLPIGERAKLIYDHGGKKHLTSQEWDALNDMGLISSQQKASFEVGDVYRGAGTAVAFKHLKESGLFEVLDKHLNRRTSQILRELIIYQLLYPTSKLKFTRQRKSNLLYLLEGKRDFKQDSVYLALDELTSSIEGIKKDLNKKLGIEYQRLLLYDLSNSYFTGTKAELGGRGESKEKRHDRYIVTYGLVMNSNNMPLDIRIWKGGTADSKTVLNTFCEWKKNYLPHQAHKDQQAIWIADRSMSGEPTLDEVRQIGLNYITGLPGNAQQAMLLLKQEEQPELFDQTELTSMEHEGKRYVLCRHQIKGYRREHQSFSRRRKVYEELKKIQNTPQNKDEKKLYHRAMKVVEKYEQTALWDIKVDRIQGGKNKGRYILNFSLNRKSAIVHDKIGHYYLLQTDLPEEQISDQQVAENYQALMKVEKSFRDIKSQIKIRPIRHWKENRIKAHIYLCYLSLWLSKYIENQWKTKGLTTEVGSTLMEWDIQLMLCEKVDHNGNVIDLKWNEGKNARQTKEDVEKYGEDEIFKINW